MTTDPDPSDTDKLHDDAAKRPFNPDGGEDEGSADDDGDESGLKDDQKPLSGSGGN